MRHGLIGFTMLYLATWLSLRTFASADMQVLAALLAVPMIWLSAEDQTRKIIPDSASLIIAMLGLWAGQTIWLPLVSAILVAAAAWLVGELYYQARGRDALGTGDAKLLGAITAVVGLTELWVVVFLASITAIAAIVLGRFFGREESGCPFGPYLSYACFLTVLLNRGP